MDGTMDITMRPDMVALRLDERGPKVGALVKQKEMMSMISIKEISIKAAFLRRKTIQIL